jgi:hypothetical protein
VWGPQAPGGGPGPQQAGGPGRQQRPGKHGKLLRWTGGIAAAVLLAGGGAVAGLKLAGNSAPANGPDAMALNSALSSSAAPGSAGNCTLATASSAPGGHAHLRHCRRALLLRLVRGMYGQVTYHGQAGTVTLAFERGTVESAGGGHLVVRAADGTTWNWDLASNSLIRERGGNASSSALSHGVRVFVAGNVSGGAKDARLVLVRVANAGNSRNSSGQAPANSPAA